MAMNKRERTAMLELYETVRESRPLYASAARMFPEREKLVTQCQDSDIVICELLNRTAKLLGLAEVHTPNPMIHPKPKA